MAPGSPRGRRRGGRRRLAHSATVPCPAPPPPIPKSTDPPPLPLLPWRRGGPRRVAHDGHPHGMLSCVPSATMVQHPYQGQKKKSRKNEHNTNLRRWPRRTSSHAANALEHHLTRSHTVPRCAPLHASARRSGHCMHAPYPSSPPPAASSPLDAASPGPLPLDAPPSASSSAASAPPPPSSPAGASPAPPPAISPASSPAGSPAPAPAPLAPPPAAPLPPPRL